MPKQLEEITQAKEASQKDIDSLKGYLMANGFRHKGEWYFRGTWLDRDVKKSLESSGVISNEGTAASLKKSGFEFPEDSHGKLGHKPGSSLIYRVNDKNLNRKRDLYDYA